jgi:glycosyltransferase involved in cell wall biosynthesis
MRIGLNLFPLTLRGGGMRHYVMQLIPWMLRLSEHELIVFFGVQGQPSLASVFRTLSLDELRRVDLVEIDDQEQIFRHAHRFDVYFCPLNGFAPGLLDRPTLGTLADVQDQFFPQYFTPPQLELRKQLYPYMARAVTTLLTISEFSKRCICNAFGIPASKVQVTYLAPSDDVLHATPRWPSHLPPLPERCVFYPANLYPHKNHELLLRAIRVLHDKHGIDCACVMTGHEANPGIAIHDRIKANGLEGKAFWLGYVPPAGIRYLYAHAQALAFPSQFEGFGMPLVEAMYCGCPIVATPTTCIPEIAGNAALLVAGTERDFADGLARVLQDKAQRDQLVAYGQQRQTLFSAQGMANATMRAINEAPAKFFGHETTSARAPVSFVVSPSAGGDALTRTLASLAYEARDQDEILILAEPHQITAKAAALCDNLPNTRFAGSATKPDRWLEHVRLDLVCYLREGEILCRGACRAVEDMLNQSVACQVVAGQAIEVSEDDRFIGLHFTPTDAPVQLFGKMVPTAAIFSRRAFLDRHRRLLGQSAWTNWILQAAGDRCRVLYRTLAKVSSSLDKATPPPPLAEIAQGLRTLRIDAPAPSLKRIIWASVAQQLARSKRFVRRIARVLPTPFEELLRSFYFRRVNPYLNQR